MLHFDVSPSHPMRRLVCAQIRSTQTVRRFKTQPNRPLQIMTRRQAQPDALRPRFQVDAGDTKLGSRKVCDGTRHVCSNHSPPPPSQASFHHLAAPPSDDADFSRRAVVFRWKDVTADMLENVVEDAAAIVISLPPVDESLSDDDLARWFAVEALLSNSTVPCPLYFVENSAAWSEVVDGVLKGGFDGTLTLAVDAPPPKRLDAAAATNFQTFFSGSDGKHTIAIVAHYDSASPAPTLARGATSNGSGMVLLFALLRLFRTLYDDETTRPAANLMFVITAAGHSNYAGTRHWLINSDSRLLDSVDFVLCIDSVGLSDGVHLHVSRPLKDDATKRMYGSLQSAAAEMTPPLPFTMHQRKIDLGKNVSGMDGWHHEVIPRSRPNLRILAATLSSKPAFSSEMRASILDRSPPPLNKMIRDFEFATRAVSKMLYAPHAAATVLKSSTYLSSSEFIKVACETVAMTPRSAAHTSSPSPVLDAIASLMSAGSGKHPLLCVCSRVFADTCHHIDNICNSSDLLVLRINSLQQGKCRNKRCVSTDP